MRYAFNRSLNEAILEGLCGPEEGIAKFLRRLNVGVFMKFIETGDDDEIRNQMKSKGGLLHMLVGLCASPGDTTNFFVLPEPGGQVPVVKTG